MPFQKGQSGNPGGRPKKAPELKEVEALARTAAPEAIERLTYWMRQEDARASVAASNAILDRGFGKPTQPTDNQTTVTLADAIDRPPNETRDQWLARRERELATAKPAGHAD